jgi:general secretion pathway protein N
MPAPAAFENVNGLAFYSLIGALIGFLLSLILFAPASWLRQTLQELSAGRIVLEDCRGTIWHGSAILLLTAGPTSRDVSRLPERLHWDVSLHPSSVNLELRADCCTQQPLRFVLEHLSNGWQFKLMASKSSWPLAVLEGLGTPWNSVHLRADMQVSSSDLSLVSTPNGMTISGTVVVQTHNIHSSLSGSAPLGSYRLEIKAGLPSTLQVQTIDGDLHMNGQGEWSDAHLRLSLQLRNSATDRPDLNVVMNILGLQDGEVHFRRPN